MNIDIKVKGLGDLTVALRHAGERVSDTARKTMHRQADRIVKRAQLYAPVDKHNLEKSIHKEVAYGDRGRLEINIVAGGFVNGVNVDEYVIQVHENYQNMGPGTLAKQAANPGVVVGRLFLKRALEENREKLEQAVISAVLKEWHL